MIINKKKCSIMPITKGRRNSSKLLYMPKSHEDYPFSSSYKYLGTVLNSKLEIKNQIG